MNNFQFVSEAQKARFEFVNTINKLPWNNKLRTKSESLLIMYDQMTSFISSTERKITDPKL
jgi:hypothetical protein